MVPNRLSIVEIAEYNRSFLAGAYGPWDLELIATIDDAVMDERDAKRAAAADKTSPANMIPLEDGPGVHAMMSKLTIQQNARVAAQKARAAK